MVKKGRRLTRRDMKQKDQVISRMESLVAMASERPRLVGSIGIGIVLLFALVMAGYYWWSRHVQAANRELGEVTRILDPTGGASDSAQYDTEAERVQTAADGAGRVADKYGYTGAGRVARLVEASSLARLGRLDQALELYSGLASDKPSDMVAGAAALARAELLAANGREDDAEQALRGLASAQSAYVPRDMVLRRLAELLESREDVAGAIEVYQRLVDEVPDSPFASEARSKLEELEQETVGEDPEVTPEEAATE